jgi:magnesium transporter
MGGDLKARLLLPPPRPKSAASAAVACLPPSSSDLTPRHLLFQGVDDALSLLKKMKNKKNKRGHQAVRSWVRIDTAGNSQVLELDKVAIMRRCDLPARDLRLLDPLFVYPSTILGRERAIVVNLEQIRCIITADEVLLLNSLDNYDVLQYVIELQRRLLLVTSAKNCQVEEEDEEFAAGGFNWRSPGDDDHRPVIKKDAAAAAASSYPPGCGGGNHHQHPNNFDRRLEVSSRPAENSSSKNRPQFVNDGDMFSGSSSEYLPFEFRALEVALEAACIFLDTQAAELEKEVYPVLDELTSKISTLNLERVRRLKSHLVALTRRVQKVRSHWTILLCICAKYVTLLACQSSDMEISGPQCENVFFRFSPFQQA